MFSVRERSDNDLPDCVNMLRRVFDTFTYPAQWPQDPASWIANDTERSAWVATGGNGSLLGHIDIRSASDHPVTALWCKATGRKENELAVVSRLFVDPNHIGVERLVSCSPRRQQEWQRD
jgi:hypothetical protein